MLMIVFVSYFFSYFVYSYVHPFTGRVIICKSNSTPKAIKFHCFDYQDDLCYRPPTIFSSVLGRLPVISSGTAKQIGPKINCCEENLCILSTFPSNIVPKLSCIYK